jgi:hypothetical protein
VEEEEAALESRRNLVISVIDETQQNNRFNTVVEGGQALLGK